jgi:hypothetical protein
MFRCVEGLPSLLSRWALPVLASCSLLGTASGCNKEDKASNRPGGGAKGSVVAHETYAMDREGAPWLLVEHFQEDHFKDLLDECLEDLHEDLTPVAFEEIALVLKWLGPLEEVIEDEADEQPAGSHYTYELQFKKGLVHLAVTLLASGELVNFHFTGEDFIAAEHGALEDGYAQFKVYDFQWTDELGNKNPKGNVLRGGRLDYRIVLGGIEAELGEHHLSFEKIVVGTSGQELVHEPVEFDQRFEQNAEGIPRARLQMFVLLEDAEAGEYDLVLKVSDNISGEVLEHKEHFEIE